MKANVKWLGEPESKAPSTTQGGYTFPVGEFVEVTDKHLIEKAQANHFFEVQVTEKDEEPKAPPTPSAPAPSRAPSPQEPVVKHGEPDDLKRGPKPV